MVTYQEKFACIPQAIVCRANFSGYALTGVREGGQIYGRFAPNGFHIGLAGKGKVRFSQGCLPLGIKN